MGARLDLKYFLRRRVAEKPKECSTTVNERVRGDRLEVAGATSSGVRLHLVVFGIIRFVLFPFLLLFLLLFLCVKREKARSTARIAYSMIERVSVTIITVSINSGVEKASGFEIWREKYSVQVRVCLARAGERYPLPIISITTRPGSNTHAQISKRHV